MGTIIKQLNKKSGVTYCYYQESYWVPGVGPRSKRRLIGRLDPMTGEIVPTGRSGPRKKSGETDIEVAVESMNPQDQVAQLKEELLSAAERIQELESELAAVKSKLKDCSMQLDQAKLLTTSLSMVLAGNGQAQVTD